MIIYHSYEPLLPARLLLLLRMRGGGQPLSQVVSGRCAVMLKGHQVGSLELQGLDLSDMSESEARLEAACVSP